MNFPGAMLANNGSWKAAPLRAKAQGTPCTADPPFEERKPLLTGRGAVTTVSTIIYDVCRSTLAWRL